MGVATRRMAVSQDIYELVYGDWISDEWENRRMGLIADIDHYLQGGKISAVLPDGKKMYAHKPNAKMRLLQLPRDEVWEFRSTHKNPEMSIRMFGRFAVKDFFIALNWEKRPYLAEPESPQWKKAKKTCKSEWAKLFPVYPPLKGDDLHDYLSNSVLI